MLSRYIRTGVSLKRSMGLRLISKMSPTDENNNKEYGLHTHYSKFISKVYTYSGGGVLATTGLSMMISPITSQSLTVAMGSIVIGTIGMFKGTKAMSNTINMVGDDKRDRKSMRFTH